MKWISVKDRLPEHKQLICFLHVREIMLCGEYRHEVDEYSDGTKDEYTFFECWDKFGDRDTIEFEHVTHWMPLPEPPKQD